MFKAIVSKQAEAWLKEQNDTLGKDERIVREAVSSRGAVLIRDSIATFPLPKGELDRLRKERNNFFGNKANRLKTVSDGALVELNKAALRDTGINRRAVSSSNLESKVSKVTDFWASEPCQDKESVSDSSRLQHK